MYIVYFIIPIHHALYCKLIQKNNIASNTLKHLNYGRNKCLKKIPWFHIHYERVPNQLLKKKKIVVCCNFIKMSKEFIIRYGNGTFTDKRSKYGDAFKMLPLGVGTGFQNPAIVYDEWEGMSLILAFNFPAPCIFNVLITTINCERKSFFPRICI